MYKFEEMVLNRITKRIRERFPDNIAAIYVFGSKVKGDYYEQSDFDVLVVVHHRIPSIEHEIIGIFVEEELKSGLNFTPVIKDSSAFEHERKFQTPFYQSLEREGIVL